jgi:hypothetical protein
VEYHVRRLVSASPDRVWSALLEVGSWPQWDIGTLEVEGSAVDGGKVKVASEVRPGRAFPVRVRVGDQRRVMTWTGGMPLGLFKGVRTFRVVPDGEGSERDVHEEFSGWLARWQGACRTCRRPWRSSPTASRPTVREADRGRTGDRPV